MPPRLPSATGDKSILDADDEDDDGDIYHM